MTNPLTPEELATARELRDRGMSWRKIGREIHREPSIVRDSLVALGYSRESRTGHRRTAADVVLLKEEMLRRHAGGHSLKRIARELHCSYSTVYRWLPELGVTLPEAQVMSSQQGKRWGVGIECIVGGVMDEGKGKGHPSEPIGSFYCAGHCDWHEGMCDDEVTPENREGFERFKQRRAEQQRKLRDDKGRKRMHRAQDADRNALVREVARMQRGRG